MLFMNKYGNPYYLIISGTVLIVLMSYLLGMNPGDILQTFFLILGFIFVIAGSIILITRQKKKKLTENT